MIFKNAQLKVLSIYFILFLQVFGAKGQVTENVYVHTDKSVYHPGEIIWLRVDVVNGRTGEPLNISKVVYVELVNASDKPVLQCKVGTKDALGKGFMDIPENINSGKYTLRAYTNWMKNFSPDYYFSKHITVVNINDSVRLVAAKRLPELLNSNTPVKSFSIEANSDKKIYRTRDKITLDISASSEANLSLSVYKIDSLQPLDTSSINICMSRSTASLPNNQRFSFSPEYYGHIITGKVIDNRNGNPAAGIAGYLSVPGARQFFQTAVSDAQGNIFFDMKDFYGVNEVVLQTNSIEDSNYIIELATPFSAQYANSAADSFDISRTHSSDMVLHAISAQVQLAYFLEQRNRYLFPSIDSSSFYGKADAFYNVSEYVKFASLEDILREYVTQVGVKKRDGELFPFIYDKLRRQPFSNAPLLLVNHMPVFNTYRFMSMNPSVVKNIEVIEWRYFKGQNSFDGIISLVTINEGIEDFDMEKNAVVVNYDGLLPERKFYSPVYENDAQRDSRSPDFRNVLYWQPEMAVASRTQKIEFYSSDIKGDYAIVLQGLTQKGEAASKISIIKIE